MSVARFVADQRTNYRVPHSLTCALLGISVSWFYKWLARAGDPDGLHTDTDRRRAALDDAVRAAFAKAIDPARPFPGCQGIRKGRRARVPSTSDRRSEPVVSRYSRGRPRTGLAPDDQHRGGDREDG